MKQLLEEDLFLSNPLKLSNLEWTNKYKVCRCNNRAQLKAKVSSRTKTWEECKDNLSISKEVQSLQANKWGFNLNLLVTSKIHHLLSLLYNKDLQLMKMTIVNKTLPNKQPIKDLIAFQDKMLGDWIPNHGLLSNHETIYYIVYN